MADKWMVEPIAYIRTDFSDKFGIPRQSGRAPSLMGRIVFEPKFRTPDAIRGIEGFSHLWLIFDFSKAHREGFSPVVRPPRLGGNRRVGVFASRSPFRPNPIGLTCVKLERVEFDENEGHVLIVSGVDLLNMTPIIDIKPYIPFADSHPDAVGSYADEESGHKLHVVFPDALLSIIPENKRAALIECLSDDPRPSYQHDPNRKYSMRYSSFDVHFHINGSTLEVVGVDEL